jgi:hypothetical protein
MEGLHVLGTPFVSPVTCPVRAHWSYPSVVSVIESRRVLHREFNVNIGSRYGNFGRPHNNFIFLGERREVKVLQSNHQQRLPFVLFFRAIIPSVAAP